MQNVDAVAEACEEANRLLEAKAPPQEILACLASAAERVAGPRAAVSILRLDEAGLLRNGASPKLPEDYLSAIDGLKPHPGVGTCAAAAATGSIVLTPDFRADDKWAELRHLPMALGYLGAWSMPIKSPGDDEVLGTFGTYFMDVREPSPAEMAAVASLAALAARALDARPG